VHVESTLKIEYYLRTSFNQISWLIRNFQMLLDVLGEVQATLLTRLRKCWRSALICGPSCGHLSQTFKCNSAPSRPRSSKIQENSPTSIREMSNVPCIGSQILGKPFGTSVTCGENTYCQLRWNICRVDHFAATSW
jgi:hypothetical protein